MTSTSQPRLAARGFTLIELLTVIAIIAILMGLLFPAVSRAKENRLEAKNACLHIVNAVKAYHTEYGKYPAIEASGTADPAAKDIVIGDPACQAAKGKSNKLLFDTLRAISRGANEDHTMNPRKIIFLENKSVADKDLPRSGFVEKGGDENEGCYFDPWGKQYCVIVDTNYDHRLDIDQIYQDESWSGEGRPRAGVGAFAMGRDNVVGTKEGREAIYKDKEDVSDDVISW